MHDFMVVGAGMFGATFARCAVERGYTCMVIDRKPHIAGAAYDVQVENYFVHQYGAHIFHTNSESVWRFVNRFADWFPFINKPKVYANGRVWSFPINMMTMHQLWGVVTPHEAAEKLERVRVPCETPRNFEEWALSKMGEELYRLFIYGYTKKQYMREPSELPASIIQRLPIRLTYEEAYFSTKYQAMPVGGYTSLIGAMLDGIKVETGTPLMGDWRKYAKRLVYTGPVDQYLNCAFGPLEYSTLKFEFREFQGDYQGNAVFNHPDVREPQLRTVEFRHFETDTRKVHLPRTGKTVVGYDIPTKEGEPLYPVNTEANNALHRRYVKALPENVIVGGRLGEYRYYDMDQAIASAMKKADL